MKSAYFVVLLFVSFAVFATADEDNDNWPCYLKKCAKNDPDLKTCLLHHSNRALNSIAEGDSKLGIPSLLPLLPGDLIFGRNRTFKIKMSDVQIFGAGNLHVVDMDWNFDKKTIDIKLVFNTAITISGNFESSGTFKNLSISGMGHADLIFVGGSQGGNKSYSMSYDLIKVLGRDYVQIKNSICSYQDGFRVEFNNLMLTPEQGEEHRKYLNDHSVEVNDALRPEVNGLICAVINAIFNPIFFNFPLNLIFDYS